MRVNNDIPIFIKLATDWELVGAEFGEVKLIKQLWWGRLQILTSGTNGDIVITIETSFDQVNWVPWNECSKLKITDSLTHIRMYELDGLYYRLVYHSNDPLNTNTSGTLTASLFIKELK